jgi:hypothetical protein
MFAIHLVPFLISYIAWHYSLGLKDLFGLIRNFLWFSGHIFSIPLLFRTLFSPWKRMNEAYPKGLNLSNIGEALLVNTLMRLVGALVRLSAIFIGVLFSVLITIVGATAVVLWMIFPALIPFIAIAGLYSVLTGGYIWQIL